MTILDSSDCELFQRLLSDAFAIQKSGVDIRSLYTVVEVQRSIDSTTFDIDHAIKLIAENARNIAHANGIAIARVEANQLCYILGVGSAKTYAGRRMLAVFTRPADQNPRREILRVENAQADKRIEATICKQFGTESLLILPIFESRKLKGILQVFFTQKHFFQDREVNAYRLMAGLIGEVMGRDFEDSRRKAIGIHDGVFRAVYPDISKISPNLVECNHTQRLTTTIWNRPICKAGPFATQVTSLCPSMKAVSKKTHPLKRAKWGTLKWQMTLAVTVIAFVATWIAHEYTARKLVLPGTNCTRESSLTCYQPTLENHTPTRLSQAVAPTEQKGQPSRYKRTPTQHDGAECVANNVVTRHFAPTTSPPQIQTVNREVNIGQDVTVRLFTYKHAVVTAKPTPGSIQ